MYYVSKNNKLTTAQPAGGYLCKGTRKECQDFINGDVPLNDKTKRRRQSGYAISQGNEDPWSDEYLEKRKEIDDRRKKKD